MLSNRLICASTAPTQLRIDRKSQRRTSLDNEINNLFCILVEPVERGDSAHSSCDHDFSHCKISLTDWVQCSPHSKTHIVVTWQRRLVVVHNNSIRKSSKKESANVMEKRAPIRILCRAMANLHRLCSHGEIMIFIFDDYCIYTAYSLRRWWRVAYSSWAEKAHVRLP